MTKIKYILEAVIVITIALAFVLPGVAVVTNTETNYMNEKMWEGKTRREISEVKTWSPTNKALPVNKEGNVAITGWAEGDARRPSITKDSLGNVFITYQFDVDLLSSPAGFAWNPNPTDQEAWWTNGVTLTLEGVEMLYYPDTATCEHPSYPLMNVFMAIDTEEAGGMYIPDATDYENWEIFTWTNGAPEPELAEIADGGWYSDNNYDDVFGPFNFYIYREIYDVYDLKSCPTFFHTGIDAASGVGYFDAQSKEKTIPSSDPDQVNLPDRIHTSIYNRDTEKVIWKKIVPTEECDYEYTEYQATVADGTNPAIAAYDNQVVIVYHNGGQIKCVYSSDDGATWSQPVTIGAGQYPDAIAIGNIVYAAYVNNANLYLVTSENGGATWGDPVQMNDEDGSVVAEENCIDVHEAGIVWVDNRELNDYQNIYYVELPATGVPPTNPTCTYDKKNKEITVVSTDEDGDQIRYGVSWNNTQVVDEWTTYYNSGVEAKIDVEGKEGKVGVIAEDTNGARSGWTSVTPKSKSFSYPSFISEIIYRLLQRMLQL